MVPNGWSIKTLDEIARISSGGTPSKRNDEYWEGGDIPWVRTTEVQNCVIEPSNINVHITKKGLNNSSAKLFPKGTILLAMIGQGKTRGQVALLNFEASTNQNCAAIILKDDYHPYYYFSFLLSKYESIRNLSNSAGQSNLSGGLVKTIKVPVPPLQDQRKIAKILSTWDKAISTTERLIDNSKQQKKALMQQLLTGNKRLLDDSGKPFEGDWVNSQIGGLVKEVKRPVTWKDDEYYKLLSVKRRAEGIVLREVLHGSQILTKKMNIAKSGDVLISKMQIVHGAIGYVNSEFDNHHISGSYISLAPREQNSIDMLFFSWFAKQKIMYHKAYLSSYGVHIEKMTFNFGLYLKEKIFLPSNIDEQRKIAAVLTNADKEIELLEQQLADLKQEKKALMQQLLTGKRRVKIDDKEVA